MQKGPEGSESRPVFGARRREGELRRTPLIDLSVTGEGPTRKDPTAPIDAEKLLDIIRRIQAEGQIARSAFRAKRGGTRH